MRLVTKRTVLPIEKKNGGRDVPSMARALIKSAPERSVHAAIESLDSSPGLDVRHPPAFCSPHHRKKLFLWAHRRPLWTYWTPALLNLISKALGVVNAEELRPLVPQNSRRVGLRVGARCWGCRRDSCSAPAAASFAERDSAGPVRRAAPSAAFCFSQSLAEDKGLGQLKGQEYRSMVAQLMRGLFGCPSTPRCWFSRAVVGSPWRPVGHLSLSVGLHWARRRGPEHQLSQRLPWSTQLCQHAHAPPPPLPTPGEQVVWPSGWFFGRARHAVHHRTMPGTAAHHRCVVTW